MRQLCILFSLILLTPFFACSQSENEGSLLLSIQPLVDIHLSDSIDVLLARTSGPLQIAEEREIQGLRFESRYDLKNALDTYLQIFGSLDPNQSPQDFHRIAGRLGHVLNQMGEWKLAGDYFDKTVAITDSNWSPWVSYWQAQYYHDQGIIGTALNEYQKSIQGFSASSQILPARQIAFTLGDMQSRLGNRDQAEQYYLMALDLANQLNDTHGAASTCQALAWNYFELGELALTKQYAAAGLSLTGPGYPVLQARLTLLHEMSAAPGMTPLEATRKADALLIDIHGYQPGLETYYLEKASLLERANLSEPALLARKQYDMFRDSAWNLQQTLQADQLVTRFESELQVKDREGQISRLESDQQYKRIIILLLVGLLLTLTGFLIALFLRYKQKRKDHELLVDRNAIIERQHEEIAKQNEALQELNERLISEIADREYLEHSQEQNAHYLAALSQELRNPLQAIQGISGELLLSRDLDPYQKELQKIRGATQDIVQYLNDLLDKARLESGKIIFAHEVFDPGQTVNEVCARFQELAKRRGISLELDLQSSLDTPLVGDAIRLTQILSNLLKVVFQQEELKAITLTLFTREGDSPDGRVLDIDIASDGRVANPDLLREVLTDPLEGKGQKPGAYYNGHTGLLLSRRLVELQQGLLLLETQANATHIRIWLPYATSTDGHTAQEAQENTSLLAGKRILLAEDNRLNQWVVTKILEEKGASVTVCDDGLQAVEAFDQAEFDLVIMDLQMPELDGYRATQSIRKKASARGMNIPILAMTASAYVISSDKASLFSMDDYLGKPFERNVLIDKVLDPMGCQPGAVPEAFPVFGHMGQGDLIDRTAPLQGVRSRHLILAKCPNGDGTIFRGLFTCEEPLCQFATGCSYDLFGKCDGRSTGRILFVDMVDLFNAGPIFRMGRHQLAEIGIGSKKKIDAHAEITGMQKG